MSKKDLIQELAAKGRRYYGELKPEEQRAVVACIIRELPTIDKGSLLVDADREARLPDLVANVINDNGTYANALALMQEIVDIFVYRDAYFAEQIDEALEDEMREQQMPYIDDMRRQDAAERANDMRKAC